MRHSVLTKLLALLLVVTTLVSALPLQAYAQQTRTEELYLKSVKLARAEKREDARKTLEAEGYIFLDANLNEGTGEDGIWMGYTTTADPSEAIYDMKLMNMKGGFTLTSMEKALENQQTAFAEMTTDLYYLVEGFAGAYEDESIPAVKSYQALNFFRMVEGETELQEENGLGYHLVTGNISRERLTEMILFCQPEILDSVVRILATGIQLRSDNWLQALSQLGPVNGETVYHEDPQELDRRAGQLLTVLKLYAQAYNAMEAKGITSGEFDELMEIRDAEHLPAYDQEAADADVKKLEESRYKSYKLAFDELEKYPYGEKTLKDFICSLEDETDETVLYPLVSVLSDGEFGALSYGCFFEMVLGADAKLTDFDSYDETFALLTQEMPSLYLYIGVDKALLEEDSVIGFTETANRHMAATGELEFYQKESWSEDLMENGKQMAMLIGAVGMGVMGVAKVCIGTTMIVAAFCGASTKIGFCAGLIKFCAAISGPYAMIFVAVAAATVAVLTFLVHVINQEINGKIDWDANPMPEYLYDVREVGFTQSSENEGIATEYIKRPVFSFYEAVRDINGDVVDLNARSGDASQWIALYVSHDRQGDDAKPIRAQELLVRTGNGQTPEGYAPLTRFGEVIAYDLNQWDEDDDVNGIYLFYRQDQTVSAAGGRTYYISEVYLQAGKSASHCQRLLEAAGYSVLNVNLSPDHEEQTFWRDKIHTYLGYKVTTNPKSAIRDLRLVYGPNQGTVHYGAATYAECGTSAGVTLYATKYECAGSPLLLGGLLCVNDRDDAPLGYEPVNSFAGGPALSFNVTTEGVKFDTREYYLYFLPETTFTEGTEYLGGISYFHISQYALTKPLTNLYDKAGTVLPFLKEKTGKDYPVSSEKERIRAMNDYAFLKSGYHVSAAGDGDYADAVLYYITHNPYRGLYGFKATNMSDAAGNLVFENLGYVSWNETWYKAECPPSLGSTYYTFAMSVNGQGTSYPCEINGTLYLMGNPSAANVYDGRKGQMKQEQPVELAEFVCLEKGEDTGGVTGENTAFVPVTELYGSSGEPVVLKNNTNFDGRKEYTFYAAVEQEDKPYISGVTAIDELSLYRAYGGEDAGVSRSDITNAMLLNQLAAQGATGFCDIKVSMRQQDIWDSAVLDSYDEMNALKFGYMRTDTAKYALRDMFLYFNGFSLDEPPQTLYRGSVKYSLLCEIPYNLTGYEEAPGPGVYLYGTTDKDAGDRITDFAVSATPFKDGYETVRTLNGRSLAGEIYDYMDQQKKQHFMGKAEDLFGALRDFFKIHDDEDQQENGLFYIHIQREGDDLRTRKPYISQLYLASCDDYKPKALDKLFDLGAEGYLNKNLNDGVGGKKIYLGYSYTADPEDAITSIRPTHNAEPMDDPVGSYDVPFTLVSKQNLNEGAGGDKIYLYYTKSRHESAGLPITELRATGSLPEYERTDTTETLPVMRWDRWDPSNMNAGTGKNALYLTATKSLSCPEGTYEAPDYGKDKTYSRKGTEGEPEGKYIAALYVMDKNTLRQEKLAAGTPSDQCRCQDISDEEVFRRLEEMGATTVLETPICISADDYGKKNQNKVFIGYSRTDTLKYAIKSVVIQTQVLSLAEPAESIDVNRQVHKLVAEPAQKVTQLPRAINLIGLEDCQDMLLPRFYLYTSTAGKGDPIYDISISANPIENGWVTAISANGCDPFRDVYDQAKLHYKLGDKDDSDSYDSEIVYTDQLYKWMGDVAELFDPQDREIKPFYLHCKIAREDEMPYIGEVFVTKGDNKHEALSEMLAYSPDGYIDCDLNRDAGGDYVYLGYRHTAEASDAITGLVVFEGKNPQKSRRIYTDSDTGFRFDLVANVDLNSDAGGDYLYLYTTDDKNAGTPVLGLRVTSGKNNTVNRQEACWKETTVRLAKGQSYTNTYIDLNEDAGGDYLYLVAKSVSHIAAAPVVEDRVEATCGKKGSYCEVVYCTGCGLELSRTKHTLAATGIHTDGEDADHDCDICGARDIEPHTPGAPVVENREAPTCVDPGSYEEAVYCDECGAQLSREVISVPATAEHVDGDDPDHHCDVCGAENVEDHTPGQAVEENRVEATCGTEGAYEAVVYCTECLGELSRTRVILPATGAHVDGQDPDHHCDVCGAENVEDHTPDDPVEENRTEPTGTLEGGYDLTVYCAECGQMLSTRHVAIPAAGEEDSRLTGTVMGTGSLAAIGLFAGVGVLAAVLIALKKRGKKT